MTTAGRAGGRRNIPSYARFFVRATPRDGLEPHPILFRPDTALPKESRHGHRSSQARNIHASTSVVRGRAGLGSPSSPGAKAAHTLPQMRDPAGDGLRRAGVPELRLGRLLLHDREHERERQHQRRQHHRRGHQVRAALLRRLRQPGGDPGLRAGRADTQSGSLRRQLPILRSGDGAVVACRASGPTPESSATSALSDTGSPSFRRSGACSAGGSPHGTALDRPPAASPTELAGSPYGRRRAMGRRPS